METKLINKSQVKKALKVKGLPGNIIASAAMSVAGLNKINTVYSHIQNYEGIDFADNLLKYLNVSCEFSPDELENLPKDKPFIVVSNHPFGGIDGIIMLSVLGKVRPDIKILTNFLLSYIPNLEEYFLPVNPFTDKPGMRSSLKGLKMAKEHLAAGGVLGLFPAGEVSSDCNPERIVKDIEWQPSIIKLIKGAGLPIVPIYFDGENSKFFHLVGKINPILRTIRLPHELVNKRDKVIKLKIGRPIASTELEEFLNLDDLGRHLWNRTYSLEANIEESTSDNFALPNPDADVEPVAPAIERGKLCAEVESIADCKLFNVGAYECYLVGRERINLLLHEIGRCREVSFRAIGEGTNNSLDIDKYDEYYKHLILWDKENSSVVGAYRLGIGDEIVGRFGLAGFYSHSLFRYKEEFLPYLSKSIELGRSFVSLEYQKDPLALMLLIKGLMYSLLINKHIRYFIGPVSISAWYPYFYRSLIIYYLQQKQSVPELANYISPKIPFKLDFNRVDINALAGKKFETIEKFDRFMLRLSNNKFRLPTLLKKYLKLNAKLLAFNVDPDFNYCVDGLIMLDLFDLPKQEIDLLSKEFEDKDMVYKRFGIEQQIYGTGS